MFQLTIVAMVDTLIGYSNNLILSILFSYIQKEGEVAQPRLLCMSKYFAAYFFEMENRINPTPSIIRVMGQGSGSPRGFGLPRIMRVESHIRRIPDIMKHTFAIFNKGDLRVNLIFLP